MPVKNKHIKSVVEKSKELGYDVVGLEGEGESFDLRKYHRITTNIDKRLPTNIILDHQIVINEQDDRIVATRKQIRKGKAKDAVNMERVKVIEEQASAQLRATALDYDSSVNMVINGGQPMISYIFERIHTGDRAVAVKLFLAARVFDPMYISTITIASAHALVNDLTIFPPIDKELVKHIKLELPHYKNSAAKEV